MAKSDPQPCPGCGTWKCASCGHSQSNTNRFVTRPLACSRCGSLSGKMVPVFHRHQAKHDDHVDWAEIWTRKGDRPRYPLAGYIYGVRDDLSG
jgi:hypothetical protein